jgi:hypothetical protein
LPRSGNARTSSGQQNQQQTAAVNSIKHWLEASRLLHTIDHKK